MDIGANTTMIYSEEHARKSLEILSASGKMRSIVACISFTVEEGLVQQVLLDHLAVCDAHTC